MSPLPQAQSNTAKPGRKPAIVTVARFHKRCAPSDKMSFMRS